MSTDVSGGLGRTASEGFELAAPGSIESWGARAPLLLWYFSPSRRDRRLVLCAFLDVGLLLGPFVWRRPSGCVVRRYCS